MCIFVTNVYVYVGPVPLRTFCSVRPCLVQFVSKPWCRPWPSRKAHATRRTRIKTWSPQIMCFWSVKLVRFMCTDTRLQLSMSHRSLRSPRCTAQLGPALVGRWGNFRPFRLKHWWILMVDKALKIPILDGLHPHLASSYIILHPHLRHFRLMVPACCWHQWFLLSLSVKHGLLLDRHVYRFTALVASCHVGSPIWISILDLWDVHHGIPLVQNYGGVIHRHMYVNHPLVRSKIMG